MIFKNRLVYCWNKSVEVKIDSLNQTIKFKDRIIKNFFQPPRIKTIDETISEIIQNKASVSRYGDGEFKLMINKNITFQRADSLLAMRLREILQVQDENFLVCLPDIFQDLSQYTDEPKSYWSLHNAKYRLKWYEILNKEKVYYNSFISRCYYSFKDKSNCKRWFDQLKLIWKDRDVVLIEGKKSRLGIGNDLFKNVKTMERILVPEEHAFTRYGDILKEVKQSSKSKLILLAAGPTATVLAYDLYLEGYQAIDIGHIDIEYEWFLRKALTKIKIENKYVCEAGAGEGVGELQDQQYCSEIRAVLN